MRPYGVRHDSHRYILNDNGKRDPVFTELGRSRARAENRALADFDLCGCCGVRLTIEEDIFCLTCVLELDREPDEWYWLMEEHARHSTSPDRDWDNYGCVKCYPWLALKQPPLTVKLGEFRRAS